jgi:hypothetical protein
VRQDLGALTKSGRPLGSGLSTVVTQTQLAWLLHLPDAMAGLHKSRSLAHHWQTHLPGKNSVH